MRRTKIICTLGPSSSSKEMIIKLINKGMNVARLNFSHGTHEEHRRVIRLLKEVREEKKRPVGILLDTKGPELRVGLIEDMVLKAGQVIRLGVDVPIFPEFVAKEVEIGKTVYFDDGYIKGTIVGRGEVRIDTGGILRKNKGINIPEQVFDLPDLTEKDIEDIRFGCREGVDMIAASFVRSARQVIAIKDLIAEEGAPDLLVLAKIENREGVKNFEEIVQVADGIMVARGDLGIELSVTQLPPLQKRMVRECNSRAKPVVIATQMLESMNKNPLPTRAEASDVANAIYDAASAVMLSGETASGDYPVEAVTMMHEIVCAAERDFDYKGFFQKMMDLELYDVPSGVARAAVNTYYNIKASAIFVYSSSGATVRRIARFRPEARIIAITNSLLTYHQCALYWGVEGCFEQTFKEVSEYALQQGWVRYGDLVVVTMGKPYGISSTTNTLLVESIGPVLVRGKKHPHYKEVVRGEVIHLYSNDTKDVTGKIVVLTRIRDKERLRSAKGVILQNHPLDTASEQALQALDIPCITRADAALALLKEGTVVRLDPALGLVFSD